MKKHLHILTTLLCISITILISLPSYGATSNDPTTPSHAYSRYGTPKYPANFTHFDYVNPKAPKGGRLTLASPGTGFFNSFNPFVLKGNAAPELGLLFDTLMVQSADEEDTMYGFLAKSIWIAKNHSSIFFELNDKAHFSNGKPVLAQDVRDTFLTLREKGTPSFAFHFVDVLNVKVVQPRIVEFQLKTWNPELPSLLGGLAIFSKDWLAGKPFDKLQWEKPIGSGPYIIKDYQAGKYMHYQRNPQDWAANHPARQGTYNFDEIRFETYQDDLSKLEAFKAGAFDATVEYRAKSWAKSYHGPLFTRGELAQKKFEHQNPAGMQGFIFNTRKPIFQDARVREALSLALDFDWLNTQFFYQQYQRLHSYFSNGVFAAQTPILPLEESYLAQAHVKANKVFHADDFSLDKINDSQKLALRDRLLKAQKLLEEAGWHYDAGQWRHPRLGILRFTMVDSGGTGMARVIRAYMAQLAKLGVDATYLNMDATILRKKRENYDFDMTTVAYGNATLPGNELLERFGSKASQLPAGDNLAGIQDPVVDALLQQIQSAQQKNELIAATRALDRYLLKNHYIIPHWFSNTHRVAFKQTLGHPTRLPLYYGAESWILSTWWMRP